MSLTLYFYKVKKGTRPNPKKKEWFCVRRAYKAWAISTEMGCRSPFNSDMYKINPEAFAKILYEAYCDFSPWDYDARCEHDGFKHAMRHRKIDWEKYDLFVLDA